MIYYVFSVYDDKAEAFLPPFVLPKEAQALRVFSDCVNSNDHQFGQHPADYTLFRFGTWNDEDGQFLLERAQHSLGNGVAFRKPDHPISPELGNGSFPEAHLGEQALEHDPSIQPSPVRENSAE
jgi:hypothetical protein